MAPIDAIAGWRAVEPQGAWMSFRKDNRDYEAWLVTQCGVVKKHIVRNVMMGPGRHSRAVSN
jgi:hypothetical protein